MAVFGCLKKKGKLEDVQWILEGLQWRVDGRMKHIVQEEEDLLKQWKLEEVQKLQQQHMVQRLGMLQDRMAMLLVPWCCKNVG